MRKRCWRCIHVREAACRINGIFLCHEHAREMIAGPGDMRIEPADRDHRAALEVRL